MARLRLANLTRWRITLEPAIGPRIARGRWANPPYALRAQSGLRLLRPPTEAALGAINYDNSILLKRPEYDVQCNPDALQDGAYHNRHSRDDQRILNCCCSGFVYHKTCQQFLHG